MTELLLGVGLAFWLGILTSISPCPLAANIAAVSYVGCNCGGSRQVFLSGLLYTLGRTAAYLALAVFLIANLLSLPQSARFLQESVHRMLGPIHIVVGMILLCWLEFSREGCGMTQGLQKRVDVMGVWGACLLGIMFSLTFCPTSAALFFGSLLPLSLEVNSRVSLPVAYGVGTALPGIVFAVSLAISAHSLGQAYNVVTKIAGWARLLTGWVFVLVGICFSLRHVF